MKDGDKWLPENAMSLSVRDGFIIIAKTIRIRTVPNLVDLYYRSVGHNANFLLNSRSL